MTSISIYVTEIATCTCMPRYKHSFESIGKQQTHSELKTLSFLLKSKFYLHSATIIKRVFFLNKETHEFVVSCQNAETKLLKIIKY